MQSNQSKSHKTISQIQWEDFEKRVWKYYEHLWYEVIYHGFEKWLKDWWIDLIVKKLWEKTKYIQCKNLKKQIDYDKIAWIYWRVVDELKFNVEFVIWANNWFDYGANKFAESKWILLMSWGDLIWVEEEDLVCSIKDNKHVHLANDDIIKDKMKRQKNADWYYDIINEEWDTVHFTDNYWDSAYDIIKHWKFSNAWLCIVYFYWATYDADTWYRTTHWFRIITTKWKCFADVGEISDIDLSWTQYEDDEDSFIQSMLEEQIEFIDWIAIVQTTTWFNILNEEWDFILPINYDNIYKENDYYIACNNDWDDWIQDEKCFTIDSNWNIKTINNSPA